MEVSANGRGGGPGGGLDPLFAVKFKFFFQCRNFLGTKSYKHKNIK